MRHTPHVKALLAIHALSEARQVVYLYAHKLLTHCTALYIKHCWNSQLLHLVLHTLRTHSDTVLLILLYCVRALTMYTINN
jgi:hypothetical protein